MKKAEKIEYTIITVCKNEEKGIGITLQSIVTQDIDLHNVEVIIIDGLSNDNTKNVVESYYAVADKRGLTIHFLSEKDNGIYDAMNKGIKLANGIWCIYLNAGDRFFCSSSMSYLVNSNKERYDIVYGDTVYVYQNRYKVIHAKEAGYLNYRRGMEFCHQSCIISKQYLADHPYSTTYKIAGDYNFFTEAYVNNARFLHVSNIISVFDKEGVSSNNGGRVRQENAKVKYKFGLINKSEYEREIKRASWQIGIRRIVPAFVVKARHTFIMKKATATWKTYETIIATVCLKEQV